MSTENQTATNSLEFAYALAIAQARDLQQQLDSARDRSDKLLNLVSDMNTRIHLPYDWNADPDKMTLRIGEVLEPTRKTHVGSGSCDKYQAIIRATTHAEMRAALAELQDKEGNR
jgi:hypothetical protein